MPVGVGEHFAGYRIVRPLGSGGMGEVYLAEHPRLPRYDALKLLRADISMDSSYQVRFAREADLAASLWHPHIVSVLDRGEADGRLWIAMCYVDGLNAGELLAQRYPGGMPTDLALRIIGAVGEALDYAHSKGLLHRDVKPANIMVSHPDSRGESQVMLADFGIARSLDDVSGLTTTNMTVGTVAYAAPEQLLGQDADGRADQYALAATAYHLLTGTQLFPFANPAVVISSHLPSAPPRLADTRPDLASLDWPLAVALAKKPADRFASCRDFTQALIQHAGPQISPAAPTQSASLPPPSTFAPAPSARRGRRMARVAGLAAAATLAVAGVTVLAIEQPWESSSPPSSESVSPDVSVAETAPAPNTGPLTGTYAADFGPETHITTGEVFDPKRRQGTLEIRSACSPSGCTAIAEAVAGPTLNSSLVFDDVGGQWIAVGTVPTSSAAITPALRDDCRDREFAPETWEVITLTPHDDGTLAGEYRVINGSNCSTSSTVALTRVADTDVAAIADPAALPARQPVPAEGFRGRYTMTQTLLNGAGGSVEVDFRTYCLRAQARCVSLGVLQPLDGRGGVYTFADGRWTSRFEGNPPCIVDDVPAPLKRSEEFDLPRPAPNPIPVIEGRGQEEVLDGSCVKPLTPYRLKMERTGD